MDYKRSNAPLNTVTRDVIKLSQDTGNVYETVCIIAKRANQIAVEMKKDLEKKLQEFATLNDNLEEVSSQYCHARKNAYPISVTGPQVPPTISQNSGAR